MLTNDVVSFEQLDPDLVQLPLLSLLHAIVEVMTGTEQSHDTYWSVYALPDLTFQQQPKNAAMP